MISVLLNKAKNKKEKQNKENEVPKQSSSPISTRKFNHTPKTMRKKLVENNLSIPNCNSHINPKTSAVDSDNQSDNETEEQWVLCKFGEKNKESFDICPIGDVMVDEKGDIPNLNQMYLVKYNRKMVDGQILSIG